ncbi:unnamed protein product [Phytophthora fragariaefolia]|uniref:Unnamed protein product n=1 Tax=Phytophthora fragariaefolia TaxID=1490495 RepID=A0A9W6YB88_9STRA|nr:unnamed protein product [Phytophthora fragariaefolia]
MLKMEEYGSEYLVLHKLGWFTVPRENLVGIGVITGHRVEPCKDRPCTGIVSFLDRSLGGVSTQVECYHHTPNHSRVKPYKLWVAPDESGVDVYSSSTASPALQHTGPLISVVPFHIHVAKGPREILSE